MIKHGFAKRGKTRLSYSSWNSMISRCLNKNHINWNQYGGRGITVCDRWLKPENFIYDMGERPIGTTLDRINGKLGYFKENCRWATKKQQANNMRTNIFITSNGETKTVAEWSTITGIGWTTINNRMRRGVPIDKWLSKSDLRRRS